MSGPIAHKPAWQWARNPMAGAVASEFQTVEEPVSSFHKVGAFCLLLFVPTILRFIEFVRIPSLVQTTMMGCIGTSIFTGGAYRAANSRGGRLLLAFTFLMCASVPFSIWRGGSFGVLRDDWLVAMAAFFAISGSTYTLEHCRKAMYAMGIGGMLILLLTVKYGQASVGGRLAMFGGTLGNPNDFATYLILGLPFCIFMLLNDTRFWVRFPCLLAVPGFLMYSLKTGSRGAMIALVGVFGVIFLKLSVVNKIKLIVVSAIVMPVILYFIPQSILNRLATFGMADEEEQAENRELGRAAASYNARRRLVEDAVVITLQNPFLGVGPGQFQSASSARAEREGLPAMWHESHNVYLTISSEMGVPALIVYLLLFWYCIRTNSVVRKSVQNFPELESISRMALCLFAASSILAFLSLFGNYGYSMLLPTLCGFTEALRRTSAPHIFAASMKPALDMNAVSTVAAPAPAGLPQLPLVRS